MLKDEFMERLKVHKVRNAKLQQELGACKRELETYRKGFIEQVDIINRLQADKEILNETIVALNKEIENLKNKRFKPYTEALKEFGRRND